jgi:hypothetical protein
MKIELIKDQDTQGQITYHVTIDGVFIPGSVKLKIPDAIETFNAIKDNYSKARTEILMVEEI